MALKIIYSEIARGDLKDIFDYIKKGSLKYANLEIKLIRSFLQTIKEDVFIGKPFEKVNNKFVREVIFKNYRIIYEILSEDKISILTVHHHARSLANNPAMPDED